MYAIYWPLFIQTTTDITIQNEKKNIFSIDIILTLIYIETVNIKSHSFLMGVKH